MTAIVTQWTHIWHNGEDVMANIAPFVAMEGDYEGYSYRVKGDDRLELKDAAGNTTMHQTIGNALAWIDSLPILDSIDPATAALGDPDVTLTCTGSNFTETSVIVFNGGAEPTTYVSETELTTIVKPSTASVAVDVPVVVRNDGKDSAPQTFSFTEPA